jgi:hypothetical protein
MFKRSILFATCVVLLSTGALAQNPSLKTPEHLRYYFVFRQISLLNQKAVAAERKGEDASRYRLHYKNFALLNDRQMTQLDQIANECLRDVAAFDTRIKQLVNEARARITGAKLEPGVPLPETTAELKQIDAERDRIMRHAYARLNDAFGESEFKRFNEKIEKSVRVNPVQVGARASGLLDHPALANQEGRVNAVSMIQEVDGIVQLYTATSLDAPVYLFYDAGVEGGIYEGDPLEIKALAGMVGLMIAEVLVTTPALPATEYLGLGAHYVVAYYFDATNGGWYDPYCFSRNYEPIPHLGEMTWLIAPQCSSYVLNPYIYLGATYDTLISQGEP